MAKPLDQFNSWMEWALQVPEYTDQYNEPDIFNFENCTFTWTDDGLDMWPTPEEMDGQMTYTKDPTVDTVIGKYINRSNVGMDTYGTSMSENPAPADEWLNHAQEEAMDLSLYLERLKASIRELEERNRGQHFQILWYEKNFQDIDKLKERNDNQAESISNLFARIDRFEEENGKLNWHLTMEQEAHDNTKIVLKGYMSQNGSLVERAEVAEQEVKRLVEEINLLTHNHFDVIIERDAAYQLQKENIQLQAQMDELVEMLNDNALTALRINQTNKELKEENKKLSAAKVPDFGSSEGLQRTAWGILSGFDWASQPEGTPYWDGVFLKLGRIIEEQRKKEQG